MRILKIKDIRALLRSEVKRAGGVSAWSRKTGMHRTLVSKVMSNSRQPTKRIIKALKVRTVYVIDDDKTAG